MDNDHKNPQNGGQPQGPANPPPANWQNPAPPVGQNYGQPPYQGQPQGYPQDGPNQAGQGYYPPPSQQGAPYGVYGGAQPPGAEKKPNKKLLLAIIIAAVAVVVVLLWFFVLGPMMGSGGAVEYANTNAVYLNEKGDVTLLYKNGATKELLLRAQQALVNNTGDKIAVLDEDGVLYAADVASGEKQELDDDVNELLEIDADRYILYTKGAGDADVDTVLQKLADDYEDGILSLDDIKDIMGDISFDEAVEIYGDLVGSPYDVDYSVYICDMQTGEDEEIFDAEAEYSKYFSIMYSDQDNQMAYINLDGEIVLADRNGNVQVIDTVPAGKHSSIQYAPDQGDMVIWTVTDRETENVDSFNYAVYAYVNGSTQKVCSGEEESSFYCSAYYNAGYTEALVNVYSNELYYTQKDGNVQKVRVDGNEVSSVAINDFSFGPQPALDYIFVTTNADALDYTLYSMDIGGEREKIASDVRGYGATVIGNILYYVDMDDTLYSCAVNGGVVSEPRKITNNAYYFQISQDGKTVWISKTNGDLYDYYMYRYDRDSIEKIDTGILDMIPMISPDGSVAAYLKDPVSVSGDESRQKGELYVYQDGSAKRIASDVVKYSVGTYYRNMYIEPTQIPYIGNVYYEDGEVYGNLYSYNGKESVKLAQDVRA